MGDDLAKSVHMARIAGSVFSDIEAKGNNILLFFFRLFPIFAHSPFPS